MHTDRCGNTRRQKFCAKGSGKEVEIQECMYRDKTNVEPEMYDYTSNNWSHWNSNEKLKGKFGSLHVNTTREILAAKGGTCGRECWPVILPKCRCTRYI